MRSMFRIFLAVMVLAFIASPCSAGVQLGIEAGSNLGDGATVISVTGVPEFVRTVTQDTYMGTKTIPDDTQNPHVMPAINLRFAGVLASGSFRFKLGTGVDGKLLDGLFSDGIGNPLPGPGYKCYGDPPTYKQAGTSYHVPRYMRCYNEGESSKHVRSIIPFPIFSSAWSGVPGIAFSELEYRIAHRVSVSGGYAFRLYKVFFVTGVDSYGGIDTQKYSAWAHTHSAYASIRLYVKQSDSDYAIEATAQRNMFGVSNVVSGIPTDLKAGPDGSWTFRIGITVQRIFQ